MLLLQFLVSFACAWGSSHYAEKRGRNEVVWFVLGALFGVLSVALLFWLPDLKKPSKNGDIEITPITIKKGSNHSEMGWYYLDNEHKQHGPVSFSRILDLAKVGDLKKESFVWHANLTDWTKLTDLENV